MATRNWKLISDFLAEKKNILITTHINSDGDAIGSQVAMAEYLKNKDIKIYLINCSPVPRFFHFLDPLNHIELYDPGKHNRIFKKLDGVVIVDLSDWPRLGEIGTVIQKHNLPVAVIDHHIPTDDMGLNMVSDQSASSTGELIYDFLITENVPLSPKIVNALYTCLLTDTGSFRFSNTSSTTHRIAADLLDKGAQFRLIYEQVYESYSRERSILMGKVLAGLKFDCDGQLAWFTLTREMLEETGADYWQTEGFSELPRNIGGVQVSLMFTEAGDGKVKVSFRSKGQIAINGLAQKFGGGGHQYAAGATLNSDLNQVMEKVLKEAVKLVTDYKMTEASIQPNTD